MIKLLIYLNKKKKLIRTKLNLMNYNQLNYNQWDILILFQKKVMQTKEN